MYVPFGSDSTLIAWGLKKSLKTINPGHVSIPQFSYYSETSFGLLDLSLWDGPELLFVACDWSPKLLNPPSLAPL